jgi:hypothetical protein
MHASMHACVRTYVMHAYAYVHALAHARTRTRTQAHLHRRLGARTWPPSAAIAPPASALFEESVALTKLSIAACNAHPTPKCARAHAVYMCLPSGRSRPSSRHACERIARALSAGGCRSAVRCEPGRRLRRHRTAPCCHRGCSRPQRARQRLRQIRASLRVCVRGCGCVPVCAHVCHTCLRRDRAAVPSPVCLQLRPPDRHLRQPSPASAPVARERPCPCGSRKPVRGARVRSRRS